MNQGRDDRVGLSAEPLDATSMTDAVRHRSAGAIVTFLGTVRDHSEGRSGVTDLVYEAYEQPTLDRMGDLVAAARERWPEVCRIALVHRYGPLVVGDDAVVVAVSAPHRPEAFAAAAWLIDEAKATLPIWKQETFDGGRGFGVDAVPIGTPAAATSIGRR